MFAQKVYDLQRASATVNDGLYLFNAHLLAATLLQLSKHLPGAALQFTVNQQQLDTFSFVTGAAWPTLQRPQSWSIPKQHHTKQHLPSSG